MRFDVNNLKPLEKNLIRIGQIIQKEIIDILKLYGNIQEQENVGEILEDMNNSCIDNSKEIFIVVVHHHCNGKFNVIPDKAFIDKDKAYEWVKKCGIM